MYRIPGKATYIEYEFRISAVFYCEQCLAGTLQKISINCE